jgi:hypothetical protein
MLEPDAHLYDQLTKMEATYRRYSADILVIAPPGQAVHVEAAVIDKLGRVGLTIQSQKTVRVAFRRAGEQQQAFRLTTTGAIESRPFALQYLGLIWDGRAMRLRSATLGRFLRRMILAIRSAENAARRVGSTRLRRRKLYRRFSHLGQSARIFGPQSHGQGRNRNFIRYAIMAGRLSDSSAIRRQVGRQWVRLEREIAKAEDRLRP